ALHVPAIAPPPDVSPALVKVFLPRLLARLVLPPIRLPANHVLVVFVSGIVRGVAVAEALGEDLIPHRALGPRRRLERRLNFRIGRNGAELCTSIAEFE